MGDGEVYNVLKYSFDRLKRNRHSQGNEFNTLQHCFLHCALYPDDEEIKRECLVREFISGGLVDERKTRRAQVEQGHFILDKLVNVCLLESCVVPAEFGGSTECVKMHDLVRSTALKICEGKYMVRAGDLSLKEIPKESEWAKDLEKVSFMNSDIMKIDEGMSPDCPKLSTLLLRDIGRSTECVKMHDLVRSTALKICEGKYMVRAGDLSLKEIPKESEWAKDLEKVSFMNSGIRRIKEGMSPNCPKLSTLLLCGNHRLEFIANSFFSKMPGLRTLDLCGTCITVLPNSICGMKNLEVLLLESCHKLESVPHLGEMKELMELNLSDTAIKEVPQGIEELFNLRVLAMNAPGLKMLPRGLFLKLGKLQHLELPFRTPVVLEEIANLKGLEEFIGRMTDVNGFNSF